MIVVAKLLDEQLDNVWYRLQRVIQDIHPNGISQIDLDMRSVEELDYLVNRLENQKKRLR